MGGAPPAKTEDQLLEESNFKYRGNMNLVLGRGKILSAIIETAVNTDFGGEIRALISRDVYSEWGKNILIPKGSRIFGSYATGINGAYGRISITWTRVDLATGYTLNLAGTGIDALGRTGNQGRVDNKFKERLSNAVLKSILDISLAKALDSIVKPQINSQTAAARSVGATNLTSIANAIFTQPGLTAKEKRAKICQDVLTAIANKTSNSFLKLSMTCNTLNTDPVASEPNKLLSLMGIINQLSDELIKDVTADSEKTQVQEASEKSFEAISDSIKSMAEEQDFHPTITIPQGTAVKIYVNKDYKFPKKAVIKSRFLK
ncbi:MAG: hypothetical protein COA94_04615 [Rickettsiales bacterium]|nr:MAG: hypothetical protein COA94_04615 [Rickettsiales bacterium]